MNLTDHYGLRVDAALSDFIEREAIPGTGIDAQSFWQGFAEIVQELAPRNRALLAERDRLQTALDEWHRAHPGPIRDLRAYRAFLQEIGYLVPAPAAVKVTTAGVDVEIAAQAGPQLVVPLSNARYALNAANARWGSLYDALYGTDALPEDEGATRSGGYNPVRGARVVAYARAFLDRAAPLDGASHRNATAYTVRDGQLVVLTKSGGAGRAAAAPMAGYQGPADAPTAGLAQTSWAAHRNPDRCAGIDRQDRSGSR